MGSNVSEQPEVKDVPVANTDEFTREEHGDREYPWTLRAVKEFGFPVATALILMSILGFVGKWMIDNQQRLIDSTVKTNEALTANLAKNAETLVMIERSMASANASQIEATRTYGETSKRNEVLNQKQIEILEGVTKTHQLQTDQLGKIVGVMDAAAKLMEPVPKQREDSLKKQDETNKKLSELLEATKKRS
jgi:hypothetical protein